ncbi:hypothetical protein QYE76_054208 [Lolium multiflorum]|uniref:CCHC-type domain-containing protein n=1 Tax=Lolium multiflorum TaxID=4521 RepID=A0AAD8SXU6_LOLMU|nr:hypothetical protein QYE76_054208 [Lolium multiflorum]
MEIIIDLVARMLVKKTLAQTQGEESSIAMLVLMNVLNKNKLFTKIIIKRLAMPTTGMTTNPTTTSSTTWTRHLIVKPMLMLKTKVIKIHQGVISETILAMTKGAENNHNMIKMRGPSLDNATHLVKIRNNIINVSQVKLVFNSTVNPMLWLAVEDLLYHPKPQEMKVDKIFRIHNYSGAKKVAMASLEFEEYANTWWEQVVTQREEKGEPPIDTWEDMKKEMQARFVPTHYKTDLFNKLQKLKQGTKTVEEFFKEMELTMMRANIQESENQTIARFFNGLNYPIKRIVEFQQYSNMVELVHQASKAERQVNEDIKYSKSKQYFASKLATTTPTTSVKPTTSSTPSKQPTIQSRMKQTVSSTASSKASTGSSNVTCFKCGTQGHKSFECKNTKVMITMENGDIETLSEGEYEALVQAAVANEEEYDEESGEDPLLCTHDPSPSLVVTRVLTTQPQAMEDQRCNIFQTRAGIGGKSIKVIIDGGSCHNLASTELCEKLNLTLRKHPHPYHVQWLSDKGNVKIQHTVTVNFKIGPYEDTVECDVVPMTVCHMLLGRPWQFDKKAIHDGYSNAYTFKVKDKKFELRPMTPSQIIADNAKALARAQHHTHHSEMRGEGATHQKESERHHPHMSERKSVLLATKSEWREVKDNPSTTIHYVLICKGLSSETNDLTNIPSSLLSLLKEFQDVFPDELPHGLPPLRGIEHRIDLIPGAPLPNRAAYRTNPEDTKEIQRQIQDLLAKGKRTPDDAEELLAKIGRNHDDWSTPEPTPTPIVKKRGMIKLNDEDMREAKKSLKEKGIKPEDVKNLPPIEDLCEITPPSSMIEDPLYPEGHPKRVEQDSQLTKTSAPSKKKKKKHKNIVESSEPVNDPNSISISDAETESGNEHEEDNDKNDTPDKEEIEKEPEKPAKNKKYTKEDFITEKHGAVIDCNKGMVTFNVDDKEHTVYFPKRIDKKRKMKKFKFGELFKKGTTSTGRPSRASTQIRRSYNEDVIAPSFAPEEDNGAPNASSFPCYDFLTNAGILDDFFTLVNRAGLATYVGDEREQYYMLTKIFVESFKFHNTQYEPTVAFKIYDIPVTMELEEFCRALDIAPVGTARRIDDNPRDLLELYRGITEDDCRTIQRGKIRNIQLPAIKYFAYYIATSILGRENTSNISSYHLAFLNAALTGETSYHLGSLIARRLSSRGPIFGGTIALRILTHLRIPLDSNDVPLTPRRLDIAAMKSHHFVTTDSTIDNMVYRMLFADGNEKEIPLPQPGLFSIDRQSWSLTKEEVEEHMKIQEFHQQHDSENAEPSYDCTVTYPDVSSSTYLEPGRSSSYYGDTTSWGPWE